MTAATSLIEERRNALEHRYPRWVPRTLAMHFQHSCQQYGERPLIMTANQVVSYAEVWDNAWRIAKGLIKLGVKRRDHIAVLMANGPSTVEVIIAISLVDCVFVPLNTMLQTSELRYILDQSDSKWFIGDGHSTADERFHVPDELIRLGSDVTHEVVQDYVKLANPADTAAIMYTAANSSAPKGALLTHENLLRCAFSTCYTRAFQDGRRVFSALPLFHVFGLVEGLLTVSFVGGALVTMPSFAPRHALQLMQDHRANDLLCIPAMLNALIDVPEFSSFDLSPLDSLMCSTAPMSIQAWRLAIERLQITEPFTGYGGTEATATTTYSDFGDPVELLSSSVGHVKLAAASGSPAYGGANVEYKVIDPKTGVDLPAGSVGELAVRGNTVMLGYYKKPGETTEVLNVEGWFRSGDLGQIGPQGIIRILGRSKDMYKVSGENVAPKEVEEALQRHAAVARVHVVGVPDAMTTEAGAAFVQLQDGVDCSHRDLVQWCQSNLAKFKVPRHIWMVTADDWPSTSAPDQFKQGLREIAVERLQTRGQKGVPS